MPAPPLARNCPSSRFCPGAAATCSASRSLPSSSAGVRFSACELIPTVTSKPLSPCPAAFSSGSASPAVRVMLSVYVPSLTKLPSRLPKPVVSSLLSSANTFRSSLSASPAPLLLAIRSPAPNSNGISMFRLLERTTMLAV